MKRSRIYLVLALGVLSAALFGTASAATQAAPTNTTPPTVTGTASVGQTLTAENGTWANSPTAYQYQWLRCGATGESCVGVPGATQKTYLVVAADRGHTLRVRVTAVNADGAANARSAQTAVVGPNSGAPQNQTRPTITGDTTVGQELTADSGTWTNTPTSYAYQWQRCDLDASVCFDVGGATRQDVRRPGRRRRLPPQGGRDGHEQQRQEHRPVCSDGLRRADGVAGQERTADDQADLGAVRRRPGLRPRPGLRRLGEEPVDHRDRLAARARLSYTRRFSTLVAPQPCGVYTRNWVPVPRFRGHGRYTITLKARDKSGSTSASVHRTFFR